MMAGAVKILDAANTALVGGHTSEGAELALGFSVNGLADRDRIMRKGGMTPGDRLILTKALGTGTHGVGWRDIEVLPDRRGKPLVYLYGRAKERAERIGLRALDVSLTHEKDFAIAAVVGMRDDGEDPQESRERLIKRLKERGRL